MLCAFAADATLDSGATPQDYGLRPKALGMFTGVIGLSVPLGPLLGGAVVEGISWPWIFWLNVTVGLLLIILARGRMEESFGPNAAIDIPGLALVTGAGFGIVRGLVRGNSAGWGSVEVVSTLALGTAMGWITDAHDSWLLWATAMLFWTIYDSWRGKKVRPGGRRCSEHNTPTHSRGDSP